MSYCVPEWDAATSGDLDVVIHSTDLFPSSKGKWESSNRTKSNFSDMAFMPDHDFEELCWENGRLLVVTQSQKQRHWQLVNSSLVFPSVSENEDTVLSSRSQNLEKDGTLEAVAQDTGGVAKLSECNNSIQEDEMASWLHNDEPLEKYCTDLSTDISSSNLQMKKGFNGREAVESRQNNQNSKMGIEGHAVHAGLLGSEVCDSLSKPVNAAVTIEIGSSKAANLQPLAGAEALHISSCPKQPDVLPSKQANGSLLPCSTLGINRLSRTDLSKGILGPASITVPIHMPPPKSQPRSTSVHSPSQPAGPGLLNFSHFSRPAAIVKANLQAMGMVSSPTGAERLIQLDRVAVEACMSADSSKESNSTGTSTLCGQTDRTAHSGASGDPQNLTTTSSLLPVQSLSTAKEATPATCVDKAVVPSNVQNSFATNNAVLGIQRGTVIEAPEPTVNSSGGSAGNCAGKWRKVAGSPEKRKNRDIEDLECQSEEPEDESADVRKPPAARLSSTKRSRAAEIHNLSERRRRDRINEKMRALQELIPTSNKTDKASLLEEAIEYLKKLQTQIQLMSFRSGISVSPVLMPPGMQHLQMSQVSSLPHVGVGIGMGMGAGTSMGMGFGMMDMNASTQARHALPFPAFPGSVVPGSVSMPVPAIPAIPGPALPTSAMFVPTMPVSACPGTSNCSLQRAIFPAPVAMAGCYDLQTSNLMDYNAYLTCQQVQPMNANMYNSLTIPHRPNQAERKCNTASTILQ